MNCIINWKSISNSFNNYLSNIRKADSELVISIALQNDIWPHDHDISIFFAINRDRFNLAMKIEIPLVSNYICAPFFQSFLFLTMQFPSKFEGNLQNKVNFEKPCFERISYSIDRETYNIKKN